MAEPRYFESEATDGSSRGEGPSVKGHAASGQPASERPAAGPRRARRVGEKQHRLRDRLSAYREARRSRPPERPRAMVPSTFTLMNLFCGFLALAQVHEGAFTWACWLIVLAGFFDALDGMTARLAEAASPFGVELDSLSDMVSFGLAPAYLVWAFGLQGFGPLGLIVAALPALCAAVRLARFNVTFEAGTKDYFEGLPTPAQALALVVVVLTLGAADEFSQAGGRLPVLFPVVLVLSGLMISRVRFDAGPRPTLGYLRAHPYTACAYGLAVALVLVLQEVGLLLALAGYLAHGIARSAYDLAQALWKPPV